MPAVYRYLYRSTGTAARQPRRAVVVSAISGRKNTRSRLGRPERPTHPLTEFVENAVRQRRSPGEGGFRTQYR
jgi:hypothetical protein